MAGKKTTVKASGAAKTAKKFTTVTVREAFERVTVPAGQDATWEEPKPPSDLKVRQRHANVLYTTLEV